ncbi:DUF2591 family protein [Cronobacter sakazakii]|nr:DUF2591 family protein [Cronobacter sakazakii]
MDYSKLSDDEINNMVGHLVSQRFRTDYCNDPGAAWPIIHDNRISLVIDDTTDEWSSALVNDFSDDMAFQHSNANKNPLRAAMITFLLMQENQHA